MNFLPRNSQKLDLKIPYGQHTGTYSTYVDEVDPKGIFLAAPTIGGFPIPLGSGHAVRLEYVSGAARISFNTRVLGTEVRGVPLVKVAIPPESDVERVQLRNMVRQEATLTIAYKLTYCPDMEENPRPLGLLYRGRTKDISGGGAQITCVEGYPKGTQMSLRIELSPTSIVIPAEVIRPIQQINEKEWWVAVRFDGISEKDQDLIISYIFEYQRELRRKGLLGR